MNNEDIARDLIERAKTTRNIKTTPDDRLIKNQEAVHLELEERSGKGDSKNAVNWDVLKILRLGIHTKAEFEFLGHTLTFRVLCDKEERSIKEELLKQGLTPPLEAINNDGIPVSISTTNGIYEFELMKLRLAKAGTSRPDMHDAVLNYASWDMMPSILIEDIYRDYLVFNIQCNININDIGQNGEDGVLEVLAQLEKKPHLLNELQYKLLLKTAHTLAKFWLTQKQLEDNLLTE
jgi:hypothetical protein